MQPSTIDRLSPRMLDVALRLTRGTPDRVIAREMGISPHTVKEYVRKVLLRCGVRSRRDVGAALFRSES